MDNEVFNKMAQEYLNARFDFKKQGETQMK